jgi:hypothetical protein
MTDQDQGTKIKDEGSHQDDDGDDEWNRFARRIDSEVAEKSEMISLLRTRNGESEKTITELRWQVSSLEGRMYRMDETITLISDNMLKVSQSLANLERNSSGAGNIHVADQSHSNPSSDNGVDDIRQSMHGKTPFTANNRGAQYYDSAFRDSKRVSHVEHLDDRSDALSSAAAPERRGSIYKQLESIQKVAESETVTRSQLVPACKLQLTSLDPADFLEWFTDWKDFQQRYKTVISPTLIVSEIVQTRLCRIAHISEQAFHMLSPVQFFELVAAETRTFHKHDHWTQVNDSLRRVHKVHWSTSGRKIVPRNHELFFDEMIDLQRKVLQAHDFFRLSNRDNIPDINGKFGSSAWFLNRIGKDYNEVVLAMIPQIKRKNYRDLESFVNTYMQVVEDQFKQSKMLRSVPYRDEVFYSGGREQEGTTPHERKEYSRHAKDKSSGKRTAAYRQPRTLHNIRGDDSTPSDSSESESSASDASANDYDARAAWADCDPEPDDPDKVVRDSGDLLEEYPEWDTSFLDVDTLNALDIKDTAKRLDTQDRFDGCLYYTIFGKCVKGRECKHSAGHNDEASKKTAAWIIRRFAQKDREQSGAPKKILQRGERT